MKWICCLVLTYKLILTLIMELEEKERATRVGGGVCQTQKPHAREKLKKLSSRYLSFWSEIELELYVEGARCNWLFLFISLSTITRTLYAFVPQVLL